uniref:Putative retrotransposon protein n=1 Tax=Oryza sativa subsp. indica TaxID=39946 RepID=C5NNX3_ORYSI|nr:putative retrotransposon protein [Oryza sativa Indica Group]
MQGPDRLLESVENSKWKVEMNGRKHNVVKVCAASPIGALMAPRVMRLARRVACGVIEATIEAS